MTHDTPYQWHIERGDDARARVWCDSIMRHYGFRHDIRAEILECSIFSVGDWRTDRGGGHAHIFEGRPYVIWLDTAQAEAAVHECAHVAWKLFLESLYWPDRVEMNSLVARVLWREADRPQTGKYHTVRELCHGYKYGIGSWSGMCPDGIDSCNVHEIVAGLSSGIMGDMTKMPPAFKPAFEGIWRWPRKMYLPSVFA